VYEPSLPICHLQHAYHMLKMPHKNLGGGIHLTTINSAASSPAAPLSLNVLKMPHKNLGGGIHLTTINSAASSPAAPLSLHENPLFASVWYHFSCKRTCPSSLLCYIRTAPWWSESCWPVWRVAIHCV